MSFYKSGNFEYVVVRQEPDPICFGSKIPRDTNLIGKALSAFQKREAPENNEEIGPGHYGVERYKTSLERTLNKIRSKKGVGPLASEDPRFKNKIYFRTPSPTRYDVIPPRKFKKNPCAPFGSGVARLADYDNKIPGPGTYPVPRKKCRKTRFMYNLGKPCMVATVEIFCTAKPIDTCLKCGLLCQGDYWHKEHTSFLCHHCWDEERCYRELFNEKQLHVFKKIRNCSFAHSHEGTSAAIRLLPKNKIVKKLRLENYLDLYIKC